MNMTAITWLGRQIAWEARLSELRRSATASTEDHEHHEVAQAA